MWPQLGPSPCPGLSLNASAALSGGLGVHRASPTSWPWWRLPSSPSKRRHLRAGSWRGASSSFPVQLPNQPSSFLQPPGYFEHTPTSYATHASASAGSHHLSATPPHSGEGSLPALRPSLILNDSSIHTRPISTSLLASTPPGYPLPVTPWTLASRLKVPSPNFHPDHTSYPSSSLSPRQASSKTPPPRDSATFSPTITAPTPSFSLLFFPPCSSWSTSWIILLRQPQSLFPTPFVSLAWQSLTVAGASAPLSPSAPEKLEAAETIPQPGCPCTLTMREGLRNFWRGQSSVRWCHFLRWGKMGRNRFGREIQASCSWF